MNLPDILAHPLVKNRDEKIAIGLGGNRLLRHHRGLRHHVQAQFRRDSEMQTQTDL
ncbi:hypothetical protein D3C85_843530 [compost metagenome]